MQLLESRNCGREPRAEQLFLCAIFQTATLGGGQEQHGFVILGVRL